MAKIGICQRCGSSRLNSVTAKCSDQCIVHGETEQDWGYVPGNIGISDNEDYVQFVYCLSCGQIQGDWPAPIWEGEE